MLIYEEAANEIIPAIRSKLANLLIERYSLNEEKVAELLGVAQAAVSKYKSGKYSDKIKALERKLNNELAERYAKLIAESGKEKASEAVCALCQSYFSFKCGLRAIN